VEGSEREQHRDEPRPGDVIAGKYKIEALLGRGAMGSVYAARNKGTGKRVALKWLLTERQADMDMIARFEREARAAGRIDHANVVTVYDVGRDGPSSFLVMELLKGYSLHRLMKQGPLPPEAAIQLMMPALRGIAAAHENHVIHRDFKPENIFVCTAPDGTPRNTKVLDFGVSKMTDELREGLSVTRTGMIIGTPYYMAPEQIRGQQEFDHRIDIYAAGVILYEMLAGRPPFVAKNYSGLVLEIATGTPPPLQERQPGIDEGLVAVIAKAMGRHPDDRYPDARGLGEALEPYSGGVTFEVRSAEWTQKIKLPRSSYPPPPPTQSEVPYVLGDSQASTRAAEDADLDRSGQRLSKSDDPDALTTSVERPERPEVAAPVVEENSSAWHVSVEEHKSPLKPFLVGAGLAALLVIVAIVSFVMGGEDHGDETLPSVATEPDEIQAPAVEIVVAADPDEVEAVPEEGVGDEVDEEASPPAMEAVAVRRQPRMSMRPGGGAMMRGMTADTETAGAMMRSHRAGDLSLDDF